MPALPTREPLLPSPSPAARPQRERERPAIISGGMIGQRKQKITGLPLVFYLALLTAEEKEEGEKGRREEGWVDTLLFLE